MTRPNVYETKGICSADIANSIDCGFTCFACDCFYVCSELSPCNCVILLKQICFNVQYISLPVHVVFYRSITVKHGLMCINSALVKLHFLEGLEVPSTPLVLIQIYRYQEIDTTGNIIFLMTPT